MFRYAMVLLLIPVVVASMVFGSKVEPPLSDWLLLGSVLLTLGIPIMFGYAKWARIQQDLHIKNQTFGGFCPHCGYNRRGTDSGVCPECGK